MKRLWVVGALAALLATVSTLPALGVVIEGFFLDDNGSQFEADIDAIAEAGITTGCDPSGNLFCPDRSLTRGEMAAFLRRSLNLPVTAADHFTDDNRHIFEEDIDAIAEAGITTGCDPSGNLFCPDRSLTRGEMAAFLRRSLNLPTTALDYFTDDNGSIFEEDIDAIAAAGITRGCEITSTRYCPSRAVSRGAMAAFLRRSLDLPEAILRIPMGDHPALSCTADGIVCTLTVDVEAGRTYRIREGVFQVLPASELEMTQFDSSFTLFTLRIDGAAVPPMELPPTEGGNIAFRNWEHLASFSSGNHTVVGQWLWDGVQIQVTTVTVRAG